MTAAFIEAIHLIIITLVVFAGVYMIAVLVFAGVRKICVYTGEIVTECMKRQQKKIHLLCKHEWIEKTSWKVYEFARCNDHISVELQCRKCGKKKTICIYENEVM